MEIKDNQVLITPQLDVDGCRQYGMSLYDINVLMNKMMGSDLDLSSLFVDYMDFISSIRAYPFEVEKLYNDTYPSPRDIPIGAFLPTGVSGLILKEPKPTHIINTFKIPRKHYNYLDYTPYTKYELFLPFYGITELDVNEDGIFDKDFFVYYTIDTYTGRALITITLRSGVDLTDEVIFKTLECKIGFDIPIGSTNTSDMIQNLAISGIGAVAGLYTGNFEMVTESVANTMIATSTYNSLSNLKQRGAGKGSIDDNRNMLSLPQKVILIRKSPRVRNVTDYSFYFGLPLCQEHILSDLTGYTEVGEIHLEDLSTATLEEREEIEELLKSGVIL